MFKLDKFIAESVTFRPVSMEDAPRLNIIDILDVS